MRRSFVIFAAFIFVALSPKSPSCAPVSFWFEKANSFYEHQAFDSAAFYYEQILSSGLTNSTVYFNLGNSYFRLKKVGAAILAYERARKLSPDDPDILANIRFANSAIADRVPEPERSFFEAAVTRLHTLAPLDVQLWLLFFLLLALSILFVVGLYASPNARLWLVYVSGLVLMLAVVTGISAGVKIYRSERVSYAVVLEPTLEAKNEPNGSKIIFTAHEGTKFRVLKSVNGWSLVSLPAGLGGWVQSSALGRI